MCCQSRLIPNHIDIKWSAIASPVFPYTSDQTAAITGYVLNNNSSSGPVSVRFLRGGIGGALLAFTLTVEKGEYKSFTTIGVDTIQIDPGTHLGTGELNININFSPF